LRQRNDKKKKLQSTGLFPLFFFSFGSTCEKGEKGEREGERKERALPVETRTGLARVCLMCERDSRFHAEFSGIVWLCVRARNMRLPPTRNMGRIESRVFWFFFFFLSACGLRIADCGCADVFCGVGLALQHTHVSMHARIG
jgi:hypothetical protein